MVEREGGQKPSAVFRVDEAWLKMQKAVALVLRAGGAVHLNGHHARGLSIGTEGRDRDFVVSGPNVVARGDAEFIAAAITLDPPGDPRDVRWVPPKFWSEE